MLSDNSQPGLLPCFYFPYNFGGLKISDQEFVPEIPNLPQNEKKTEKPPTHLDCYENKALRMMV